MDNNEVLFAITIVTYQWDYIDTNDEQSINTKLYRDA